MPPYYLGLAWRLRCAYGPGHPPSFLCYHGPVPRFGNSYRSRNYALSFRTGTLTPRSSFLSPSGRRYALTSRYYSHGH